METNKIVSLFTNKKLRRGCNYRILLTKDFGNGLISYTTCVYRIGIAYRNTAFAKAKEPSVGIKKTGKIVVFENVIYQGEKSGITMLRLFKTSLPNVFPHTTYEFHGVDMAKETAKDLGLLPESKHNDGIMFDISIDRVLDINGL